MQTIVQKVAIGQGKYAEHTNIKCLHYAYNQVTM